MRLSISESKEGRTNNDQTYYKPQSVIWSLRLTFRQSVSIQQQGNALVEYAYIFSTFLYIDIINRRGLVINIQMNKFIDKK